VKLRFWKLSGAGNDFVLLEARAASSVPALARRLCNRRRSIGADGLLVVRRNPLTADYFNADGSRAFCANGTRCAAWWAHRRGWVGARLTLKTDGGTVPAEIVGAERVRIGMPLPSKPRWNLKLKAVGKTWVAHAVTVGVPHAVVEVRGLDRFPVFEIGRALRRHPAFGEAGANVNFVEQAGSALRVRTYERGVEDETLACGTGAVAGAFWAHTMRGVASPIRVRTRGGDLLMAGFQSNGDRLERVWLEGPARITFEGEVRV